MPTSASLLKSPISSSPDALTMVEALHRASETGAAIYISDNKGREKELAFKNILEKSRHIANFLLNRGLKRGDKAIILLPTSEEFLYAFFGASLAGGVPVPLAGPLSFGGMERYFENLSGIIKNSEASFLLASKKTADCLCGNSPHGQTKLIAVDIAAIGEEKPLHKGLPSPDPDAAAFIQYTSGTTGAPKGAVITNRALMHNCHAIKLGAGLSSDTVVASWLPLFHDMGLVGVLLAGLYIKCAIHLMPPESFMYKPHRWLETISRHRATIATAPNFAYKYCCKRIKDKKMDGLDLTAWKHALNGAEPVSAKTLAEFADKFQAVGFAAEAFLPVYGMAENTLAATFPSPCEPTIVDRIDSDILSQKNIAQQAAQHADNGAKAVSIVSVGSPLAGQQIKIVGDNDRILEERRVGRILIKSPSLMQGYFNNEKATEEAFCDGWLETGDLGYAADGRLFVSGRLKDVLIKQGRNYYPYDLEQVVGGVEGVREGCVAAFSLFNPESGSEDIVVLAEAGPNAPEPKELKKKINAAVISTLGVAADKVEIAPARTIPKTSSGKIKRSLCKEMYRKGFHEDHSNSK